MHFEWLLLAFFLVAIIIETVKSFSRSMLKNTLRLGALVLAFLITFILQVCGVFQGIVKSTRLTDIILKSVNFEAFPGLQGAADLICGLVSTLISMIFFIIVFLVLRMILRIVVHYVVQVIEKKQEEKAVALEAAKNSAPVLDEEKSDETVEKAVTEDEIVAEEVVKDEPVKETKKPVKEKKEKTKKKKKHGFMYHECAWKKSISIGSGVLSGILTLAILLMPMTYLMSLVTTTTQMVDDTDAVDSPVYKVVQVLDEHVVYPYRDSFVTGLYNTFGLSDLMIYTAKSGGKIELDNGKTVYADDVLKNVLAHGMSAYAQLTSETSTHEQLGDDISAVLADPMVESIFADVIMALMDDVNTEEMAGGEDLGFVTNFVNYYKEADKATITNDVRVLGNVLEVLVEDGILDVLMSENLEFSTLMTDEESFGDLVEAISGLSAFAPTVESVFEFGIDLLGEALYIPSDDAEAYDNFMEDLLQKMQRDSSTAFNINAIRYFVYNCANNGVKVGPNNGIQGYGQFMAYEAQWEKIQSAFAHASEDQTFGYFTMEINGEWYVYDKNTKDIVKITSENESSFQEKRSPVAGLINALTLRSAKGITSDNLYDILSSYATSTNDAVSRELASRMLNRAEFVSKAVTVEKMIKELNFNSWTEADKAADSRICASIITKIIALVEDLGSIGSIESVDSILRVIDEFQVLGEVMDKMKETTCIKGLPSLLIEGIIKNEMFADYMKPAIAFQINNIVENTDKTYAESMNQIASILKLAINTIGG